MSTTREQIARAMAADPNFHPACVARAVVVRDIEARQHRTLDKEEIMQRFSVTAIVARHTRHGVRRLKEAA